MRILDISERKVRRIRRRRRRPPLETTLGLKQNTEAALRADLADLTAKRFAYDTGASDSAAKASAVTVARPNARAFLTSVRDLFKNFFGPKPSAAWVAAGWPANSIAVPATSDLLLPLRQSVALYLTANPARKNAPLNRSAANQQGQAEHAAAEKIRHTVVTVEDHYPEGGLGDPSRVNLAPRAFASTSWRWATCPAPANRRNCWRSAGSTRRPSSRRSRRWGSSHRLPKHVSGFNSTKRDTH